MSCLSSKNYSISNGFVVNALKDKWHFLVNLALLQIMQATKVNQLVFVLNVFKKFRNQMLVFVLYAVV